MKLIECTLDNVSVPRSGRGHPRKKMELLIYDKAADSDTLRERLKNRGIELIVPHKANRRKPKTQDEKGSFDDTERDGRLKEPSLGFEIIED